MIRFAVLAASLAMLSCIAQAAPPSSSKALPPPVAPMGWGVNIHFTDPSPGEIERFGEAGYRFARMDFFWGGIEKQRGVYDFSAYDRLVAHLAKVGARPYFILDYGNPLYDEGLSPHTQAGRAAFARFAGAAAAHFAGKGVIWEVWNEPNIGFWKPTPNASDYAALGIATAKAVHAADKNAIVLGPASSGFPWEYLETIFKAGLLAHLDGVSVHPYRGQNPETAAEDYARLRALIARYAPPAKRDLPLVSGEWGYSTMEGGSISEERQAQYIARQWLANLASGVNLSIFYDWRDDGDDPKENEHRFGTVRRDLSPKPSFLAAQRLIAALDGYAFRHRLRTGRTEDWRLLFQKGDEIAVVMWTVDEKAPTQDRTPTVLRIAKNTKGYETLRRAAAIRYAPGALAVGTNQPATLVVAITNPENKTASVRVAVGATTRMVLVKPGGAAQIPVPLPAPPLRGAGITPVPVEVVWNNERVTDLPAVSLVRTDPLHVTAAPGGRDLLVTVENPAGTAFTGTVRLTGTDRNASVPLRLAAGTTRAEARLPAPGDARHTLEIVDAQGRIVQRVSPRRFVPLAGFPRTPDAPAAHSLVLFVENAAQPPQPLGVTALPPDSPVGDASGALAFRYEFDRGWRYAQAVPASKEPIPANATALVLWVHADGNGDALRARFTDKTGQTFQPDIGKMDWTGWRLVTISLTGENTAHWNGANNGVPQAPLIWDALVLADSATREIPHKGEILIAAPTYVLGD